MNFAETSELIQLLSRAGATHFKSTDFEVTLRSSPSQPLNASIPQPPQSVQESVQTHEEATQKLKDLISTVSLSNEKLVDHIFPAGAGG